MIKIEFFEESSDVKPLKYAVIVTRYQNMWVLVKHRERSTWEIPAGRKETDETIDETAKRELFEETGALKYDLRAISLYSVEMEGSVSYGKLFFAEVYKFTELPESEIDRVELFKELPDNLTYPLIQPILLERVKEELEK